jgi:hypothetical protein
MGRPLLNPHLVELKTIPETEMRNWFNTPVDRSRGDRAAIVIASLCFAHCVAGPVLLTFIGFSSLLHISERFETFFLIGSAAMGIVALAPGFLGKHRRVSCLAMFAGGILCLFCKRYVEGYAVVFEHILAGIGATLLIGAHMLNLRFTKRCRCCEQSGEGVRAETQSVR